MIFLIKKITFVLRTIITSLLLTSIMRSPKGSLLLEAIDSEPAPLSPVTWNNENRYILPITSLFLLHKEILFHLIIEFVRYFYDCNNFLTIYGLSFASPPSPPSSSVRFASSTQSKRKAKAPPPIHIPDSSFNNGPGGAGGLESPDPVADKADKKHHHNNNKVVRKERQNTLWSCNIFLLSSI